MRRMMLIGAPRSGTTWLSKLIDANPSVQYLHEPDSVVRPEDVPPVFHGEAPSAALLESTRHYADLIFGVSSLKTLSVTPFFEKCYRNPVQHFTLRATLSVLRALQQFRCTRTFSNQYRVPNSLTQAERAPVTLVKSVLAGRAQLFSLAMPETSIILVGRDPRGFVASQKVGARLGRMQLANRIPVSQVIQCAEAQRRGITEDALRALSAEAQMTWVWLMLNEQIVKAARQPNTLLISYDRFCRTPESTLAEMLCFAGLEMSTEVQRYLADSTAGSAKKSRYFSLKQDPIAACQRWQKQLSSQTCREIEHIVRDTESARFLVDA